MNYKHEFLGPFLCRPSATSMGFWLSTGKASESGVGYSVIIFDRNGEVEKVTLDTVPGSVYGSFIGETANTLIPNTQYTYKLFVNEKEFLPYGLEAGDLTFRTLPPNGAFEFMLMSCHGIEAYQAKHPSDQEAAWALWPRLLKELQARPECYIGILGGDQVYMDDAFGEDLSRFNENADDDARSKIYGVYSYYWSHPAYRKVMARLPCLLMWDDHDLVDGWGSREDAVLKSQKTKWEKYGKLATQAFREMQASRNPPTGDKSGFSFYFVWDRLGFVVLDLRSGRSLDSSSGRATVVTPEHRTSVENLFDRATNGVEKLFVVSPVTAARMGGAIEQFVGALANFLWSLGSRVSYGQSKRRAFFWTALFGLFYSVLHLNTSTAPGVVQALFVSSVCFQVLGRSSSLKKYFPSSMRRVQFWIGITLAYCIGVTGFSLYSLSAVAERDLLAAFISTLERAGLVAWKETIFGLIVAMVAIFLFPAPAPTQPKKKSMVTGRLIAGSALLTFFIGFNLWRGLPGWSFTWITMASLPIYLLLSFIAFSCFGLAIVERMGAIDLIAGLDDDMRDGWSSESNSHELRWLIGNFRSAFNNGIKSAFLLCGDIHAAGLSYLQIQTHDGDKSIAQITSSPMSYVTMPYGVEKLTTSSGRTELNCEGKLVCSTSNIFYRCERNFSLIRIDGSRTVVDYYFEDIERPLRIEV